MSFLFTDEFLPALDIHAVVGFLVELTAVHVVDGCGARGCLSRWCFDGGAGDKVYLLSLHRGILRFNYCTKKRPIREDRPLLLSLSLFEATPKPYRSYALATITVIVAIIYICFSFIID